MRPARVIAWLWGTALVLSLYGAEELSASVQTSSLLGAEPAALQAAEALVTVARATGFLRLRQVLEPSAASDGLAPSGSDRGGELAAPPAAPVGTPAGRAPTRAAAAPSRPPRVVRQVLLVGASTIQFHLGAELERVLARDYAGVTVHRLGKLSTGLTRPDVFDWPRTLAGLVADLRPDLVVANFGGNDAQAMMLPGNRAVRFGLPEWESTYRARVAEIVRVAGAGGARVVLLGMSTTRDPALTRRMARINTLTEEAGRQAGAEFLSIWDLGADPRGRYQDLIDVGGVPMKSRLADGKHFSRAGASVVAPEVARRLAERYGLRRVQSAQAP